MKHGFSVIGISLILLVFCSSSVTGSESVLVNDVLQQTNKFRRSNGLPALVLNEELSKIAAQHSTNMAKGKVGFGHGGFDKRDAQARKKIKGITRFAENVAYGATSGQQVVGMWKKSRGHRKNMLGSYKYIGIGIAKDRKGRLYYTQVFAG